MRNRSYTKHRGVNKIFIINTLKKRKGIIILIFGLILGVFLLIPFEKKQEKADTSNKTHEQIEEFTQKTEKRLRELINELDGVSGAKVMIMLKSGSEYIYASDDATNSEKHVIVKDGLVYVKEYLPEINGVAVVCQGGNDPLIQAKVTSLVCSLLDLYSNHVYVTE